MFFHNVYKGTKKNEEKKKSQIKSGSLQVWCKFNYISIFYFPCSGYCLCSPEAIISLVQETGEYDCCSSTRGETGLELGSLQSPHVMRKPDMDELDVSLEVKKIWEDT